MKRCCVLIFVFVVWSGMDTGCEGAEYPRSDLLADPGELAQSADSERFVILDARPLADYRTEHIPGARHVDHDAWKSAYGQGEDASAWSDRIGKLGVAARSKVVVYDDKGMKDAARIWWMLRYWGLRDARLLNGGWSGWKAAGYATHSGGPPAVSKRVFDVRPQPQLLATMKQVLDSLPGRRLQIVDVRSDDEYCGVDKRNNKRGGAIPGAKHLEWSALIDQDSKRFKTPEQLSRLFRDAGISLDRPTATHCNGGGRAAVMAFGLELMGARDVRNYYRGWGEWGNAPDTPVVTPPSPTKENGP